MAPPFVFSSLLIAAVLRESAAGEALAPGADARFDVILAEPAPSSPWADRVDAGVRPARFAAREGAQRVGPSEAAA
jgi:hypothetical protein